MIKKEKIIEILLQSFKDKSGQVFHLTEKTAIWFAEQIQAFNEPEEGQKIELTIEQFLDLAKDHYWDTLEKDRKLIRIHLLEIARQLEKEIQPEKQQIEEIDVLGALRALDIREKINELVREFNKLNKVANK